MEETNLSNPKQVVEEKSKEGEEEESDEEGEEEEKEDEVEEEEWARNLDDPYKRFIYTFWKESLEIDLKQLLTESTGKDDVENIKTAIMKVDTKTAGLHRLSYYTPKLETLVLDGSNLKTLRELGSNLDSLTTLSVNGCNLQSLDGVWGFPNLKILLARDNSITDPSPCSGVLKLEKLDLTNNRIKDVTLFAFLRNCKSLNNISVGQNFFEDYEEDIKILLPHVRIIDDEEVEPGEESLEIKSIPSEESTESDSPVDFPEVELVI